MKKFIILIGMLVLIALPAGAMAACTGSCGAASISQSCQTTCPMGTANCNTQATCADQSLCPAGGQGCSITGCATSPSCISAGCTDGTSCQQMQENCVTTPRDFSKYSTGTRDYSKYYSLMTKAPGSRFSQFVTH